MPDRPIPPTAPAASPPAGQRYGLVLGGGGLKGFAHIGALAALAERGLAPAVIAGSSIGALIGAAWAGGFALDEMRDRALALRRKQLFRINHVGMLLDRMQSRSIYLEAPLRELIDAIVPEGAFTDLDIPMLVNSVDLERGVPLVWGTPGLEQVAVRDAVYASCALPGFFPPGEVGGRVCVDGGTIDNLPALFVRDALPRGAVDRLIAVDVGTADLSTAGLAGRVALGDGSIGEAMKTLGFAATFMRAASVMMYNLQRGQLGRWHGLPLLVVRPRVQHVPWFSFTDTAELVDAGYRAMSEALDEAAEFWTAPMGLFPRQRRRVEIDEAACTGCGLCTAVAPSLVRIDRDTRRARPRASEVEWTPADPDLARYCPTNAIRVVAADDAPGAPLDDEGADADAASDGVPSTAR